MNHRVRRITSLAMTFAAIAVLGAASAGTASAQAYYVPAPPPPVPVVVPVAPPVVSPVVPVVYPHHPFGMRYADARQLCHSHAASATSHYAMTPIGYVPATASGYWRHFRRCMRNYGF